MSSSWIGRLAGQYRMTVRQLDGDYGLGLGMTGPLFWLLPGPMSENSLTRLACITRTRADIISSLTVITTTATRRGAPYCRRCFFFESSGGGVAVLEARMALAGDARLRYSPHRARNPSRSKRTAKQQHGQAAAKSWQVRE